MNTFTYLDFMGREQMVEADSVEFSGGWVIFWGFDSATTHTPRPRRSRNEMASAAPVYAPRPNYRKKLDSRNAHRMRQEKNVLVR